MELREEKSALRRRLKEQRDALPAKERMLWDEAIAQQVMASEAFQQADCVFAYHSVGSEVDTSAILAAAHKLGKAVALPRCGKKGEMSFFVVKGPQDLAAGKYNIPEPAGHCAPANPTQRSLCLVPGLAFDRRGCRIGYGGGYYDRFLADFPGTSLGLVRQSFLEAQLPREDFDLPVDALVTQTGWLNRTED